MDRILWSAITVGVASFNLWPYLGGEAYYIGMAAFILLLTFFIWLKHRSSLASFVLLSLASNNLIDELLFDNTKLGLNEAIFAAILTIITYLRYRYARKIETTNKRGDSRPAN